MQEVAAHICCVAPGIVLLQGRRLMVIGEKSQNNRPKDLVDR